MSVPQKQWEDEFTEFTDISILGASGFVGSAVLREVAPRAARVRAISRGPAPEMPGVEQRRADLTEPGQVAGAVAGADLVVHVAAHAGAGTTWRSAATLEESALVNVGVVRELVSVLERAEGPAPVLVYTSTAQAGEPGSASPYARQKIEAETVVAEAGEAGVVRPVVVRLPTVYGRSEPTGQIGRGVLAAMARRAIAGDPIAMWDGGTVRRNVLHVHDAARAIVAAADHHEALGGGPWQLSSDRTEPLHLLFSAVAASVSRQTGLPPVAVVDVPSPASAEAHDARSDDFDSVAFRAHTGWRPVEDLERGIDAVVAALLAGADAGAGVHL